MSDTKQEVRVALMDDFVAVAEADVAIVNVEDILHGCG